MTEITKHFPNLSQEQVQQLEQLKSLYEFWNEKINVISRKDIENINTHHILHSLAIYEFLPFKKDTQILDLGTGGGLPGIPLSIVNPDTLFYLIDGTGKKIKVVEEIAKELNLQNVIAKHLRVENFTEKVDFVVSRGVTSIDQLFMWSKKILSKNHYHKYPNGLIALKGGNIKQEVKLLPKGEYAEIVPLRKYYKQEFFEEKYIVYVQG